jgi:hypothetical protein
MALPLGSMDHTPVSQQMSSNIAGARQAFHPLLSVNLTENPVALFHPSAVSIHCVQVSV